MQQRIKVAAYAARDDDLETRAQIVCQAVRLAFSRNQMIKLPKYISLIEFHDDRTQLKQLDQQIDLLQSQLNNQHQHQQYLLDNQKDMYQQIIQQHHQEQSNLQQLLENSLQSLSVHNSTQKGKIGELKIENIINNYFPDYSIQNVSKSPHQGDYHLQNHSHHIMVEIKNYDSEKIRNSQIDKLYYDLDYCHQHHIPINAAIFISLNQGNCLIRHVESRLKLKFEETLFLFNG